MEERIFTGLCSRRSKTDGKAGGGNHLCDSHERVIRCIPEDLPIPAVMAYGYTRSGKVPSVVVDDEHGALDIVNHLIENGHEKIGGDHR